MRKTENRELNKTSSPIEKRVDLNYDNNTTLNIRNLDLADLDSIAKLHIDHMPISFPKCKYYFNLLKISYSSFLNRKENFCFLANNDNGIVGYICLIKSLRGLYIAAFKNHPISLFYNIVILICKFPVLFLKGLPRRLRCFLPWSGKKLTPNFRKINYELRPIVVRADYQGSSVARTLMSYAEDILREKGEKEYFLEVRVNNIRAVNFYRKIGLKLVWFDGDIRYVMVKTLT